MTEVVEDLDWIKDVIAENLVAGKEAYDGLTSAQIGTYNRSVMFGATNDGIDDVSWDVDWWKTIVD